MKSSALSPYPLTNTQARKHEPLNDCSSAQRERPLRISLNKGKVHSLRLNDFAAHVRVHHGTCWITMEGDGSDYVAGAGNALTFSGSGLLVIEGLEDTNFFEVIS